MSLNIHRVKKFLNKLHLKKRDIIILVIFILSIFPIAYLGTPSSVVVIQNTTSEETNIVENNIPTLSIKEEEVVVTHLETPVAVKAIYMTSWVAGSVSFRNELISLIETTELNSIVIDIKDYSGRIAFSVSDPLLISIGSQENRIPDIRRFIKQLHDKDIYVIGRITVFQDPYFASVRPDLAVKKESDGTVWVDYKNISYIDPGAREMWDYIVALSKESYAHGFDELNYDYIRFPSDGNMFDIYFPFSEERVLADPSMGKAFVLQEFFSHLNQSLNNVGVVLSADVFGMTTTNYDDLNIGQVLELIEPYFDYIAPMVYPSHYPFGFNDWGDPNMFPYEVVKYSLDRGVERLILASSTPLKLRPWLQDFDYGGNYDVAEVRAQIQAVYDAGLTSWMLWAASNRYTAGALEPSEQ